MTNSIVFIELNKVVIKVQPIGKKKKEKEEKKKEKKGERLRATLSYSRLSILSGAYLVLLDGWTELA